MLPQGNCDRIRHRKHRETSWSSNDGCVWLVLAAMVDECLPRDRFASTFPAPALRHGPRSAFVCGRFMWSMYVANCLICRNLFCVCRNSNNDMSQFVVCMSQLERLYVANFGICRNLLCVCRNSKFVCRKLANMSQFVVYVANCGICRKLWNMSQTAEYVAICSVYAATLKVICRKLWNMSQFVYGACVDVYVAI